MLVGVVFFSVEDVFIRCVVFVYVSVFFFLGCVGIDVFCGSDS